MICICICIFFIHDHHHYTRHWTTIIMREMESRKGRSDLTSDVKTCKWKQWIHKTRAIVAWPLNPKFKQLKNSLIELKIAGAKELKELYFEFNSFSPAIINWWFLGLHHFAPARSFIGKLHARDQMSSKCAFEKSGWPFWVILHWIE